MGIWDDEHESFVVDSVERLNRPLDHYDSEITNGCTKVGVRCVFAMERSSRRLGDPGRSAKQHDGNQLHT